MKINVLLKSIPWHFVLLYASLAGILYAVLTISGWIHGTEGMVALALLMVTSVAVFWRNPKRRVLTGFLTGFLAALVAIELQAAFMPIYLANNPEYASVEIPFGLSARQATAVFAPLHATLAGLIIAAIVWAPGKLLGRRLKDTDA